jgi:ABC-type amino acid transport substrate-binding protein
MSKEVRLVRSLALVLTLAAPLLAAPHTAAAAEITTLKAGTLRVCLYAGFPPFVSKDGDSWKGWDVEYLEGLAKANHLTFKPVAVNEFKDIWLQPGKGKCDIAATGISDTLERRKATCNQGGDWSNHYYNVVRAYLVRTEDQEKLKDVGDLGGKTVYVTQDSTADHDLRNRLEQAKISSVTIKYPTHQEGENQEKYAADQVLAKKAFAYGGGYGSVEDLAAESGGRLKVVWPHCNLVKDGTKFEDSRNPSPSSSVRPARAF